MDRSVLLTGRLDAESKRSRFLLDFCGVARQRSIPTTGKRRCVGLRPDGDSVVGGGHDRQRLLMTVGEVVERYKCSLPMPTEKPETLLVLSNLVSEPKGGELDGASCLVLGNL